MPKRFPDRSAVVDVRAEAERLEPGQEADETRRLAGRVMARRGHGQLTFLDLVDRSGRIQLLCEEGRAGRVEVDLGDIVGVSGSPARTRRGEPSLAVDELDLLAKIRKPLPDTFHGLQDTELRYRRRYLDLLMNEDTRADFELRTRIVSAIRRYLDEEGFVEVETPVLQPRYGGAFAEPFVTHSNELDADLYLRIATELYLKRLIVGGLERVYELGKDFRNESVSFKHQPEFTMLEWYEAYADYRDTMERIEELVTRVAEETRRLAGRVMARRGHGKLVFLDLVDRSGRIQLLCDTSRTGPIDVDLGDLVGVEGKPAQSRRGEPSLAVDRLELLAKIRTPLPDTFHGLTDVEARYRRRYLDLLMNEETRADFELRTRMVTAIRRYLDAEGFLEVETPILQPRYGGGFAEPFVTHYNALDADYYLRIATELYLKRLIVGGLERVYELGKDFRNEGMSYKHQPEFTMVEWYEAYADYRDTMARMEELVASVAREVLGRTEVEYRGHRVDLGRPWQRVKLIDALEAEGLWSRDADDLRGRLHEREVDTSRDRSWADLVDHALTSFVEPSLFEPTILYDYPAELSPFARPTDDDPEIVERFEFYVGGTELGNAFTEINDSDEQAARFEQQQGEEGGEPGDPDYVEALRYGMPPTGGLGLGIDRLAMVLAGKDTIRDVVLFPALRPRP